MKFEDLYEKSLDRKVNPAVSASDLTDETVMTEIVEYVFTEDIIINLFKVLSNIRLNQGSHIGIWINGYYGSGKSHFLKYVNYCLSKKYSEIAFMGFEDAVKDFLLKTKNLSRIEEEGVSLSEIQSLKKWYSDHADVEIIMFNIGDVHNVNEDRDLVFTTIFWNQFNQHRGFNSFNLYLAQHLEKALDDSGKFQEFKEYVKSKGYDWDRNITRFAAGKIDQGLKMAKEVDPDLAIDVIRKKVVEKDLNVSVESFANELKEYIDKKNNRNYRLIFLVDEVSQFISNHEDVLLQLQSLVKRLDEVCESKVWIACTAQQTLEEVVSYVGRSPQDEVGKILGRFEVRASLQGTSPEYITQKRILDKKAEVEMMLGNKFNNDKAKLDAQFILPGTYRSYKDKDDFIAYYPFVPYQFQLIQKVLNSFVEMNYVDRQVQGNERSMINITFSIAKETRNMEVGDFISFDKFFGAMFQGSLKHEGQMAFENARKALELIEDEKQQEYYRRVAYVMFMICNLSDSDKQGFSATIDNIATLLMSKVDANKATIKNEVSSVLAYLIDKAVIRKIKTETGSEVYEFFTQEESKVAQIIMNTSVDSNTYSEEIYKIIYNHFGFNASSNRETYCNRSFNVGGNVDGKNILANNADVVVDFLSTASSTEPEQIALNNPKSHLVFLLYPLYSEDKELRQNFLYYCRVQRFAQEPAVSEERQKTKRIFQERAKDLYEKEIKPKFQQILDNCPVIAGSSVLTAGELNNTRKSERFKRALQLLFERLYSAAKLVDTPDVPKNAADLSAAILRPVEASLFDTPLSIPEQRVKDMLDRQPHDVTVGEVCRQFAKDPYGWSDYATIYELNELVRRHLFAFNYNNDPNVSRELTARNIVKDANKFTIEPGKTIPQDVINKFIEAWKHIFQVVQVKGGNDSTEIFRNCKEVEDSALRRMLETYRILYSKIDGYPFCKPVKKAIELLEKWVAIRDVKEFFVTITDARDSASQLFDKTKSILSFVRDQFDTYSQIRKFYTDNLDNFTFLPNDKKDAIESLKAIKTEETPWDNLPTYNRLKRDLDKLLQSKRKQLVAEIESKYNATFDELEHYAAEVKVARNKFANRLVTIQQKTSSQNFYTLQAAISDLPTFYAEEMRKINAAIPHPPVRVRKVITLATHHIEPLRTEADVDAYLQELKSQIMSHIDGNNDIIIS